MNVLEHVQRTLIFKRWLRYQFSKESCSYNCNLFKNKILVIWLFEFIHRKGGLKKWLTDTSNPEDEAKVIETCLLSSLLVYFVRNTFWHLAMDPLPLVSFSKNNTHCLPQLHVFLVCFVRSTLAFILIAIVGYMVFGDYLKPWINLDLPKTKIGTNIVI